MRRARLGLAVALAMMCWSAGAAPVEAPGFDHRHTRLAALLERHVRDGAVDYRGLKRDRAELAGYLDELAGVKEREFNSWVVPERLAYLINLHNAQVLLMVVDRYPVGRFSRVTGWFGGDPREKPVVRLFGNTTTLNVIVHNMLRRHYAEPAIHFALCSAARGGPPLRPEPYLPDRIYEQFADQGRTFLSTGPWNRVDVPHRKLYLSPVFKWYREDFVRKAGSLDAYVRIYLRDDLAQAMRDRRFAVRFTSYDHGLNDVPRARR